MIGSAAPSVYIFNGGRIDIGRRPEVLDQRHRLIRTNDVAFLDDGPEPNASVSRRHAHVEFVRAMGRGTGSGRPQRPRNELVGVAGRSKVPAGSRGVRLENGDELVLGHARLRVTIEDEKN